MLRKSVEINYPASGATIKASEVLVTITVRSFEIVDHLGQPNKGGEGHVVFYLDQVTIPKVTGRPALTEDGHSHRSTMTSYRWSRVKPGRHTLAVQLVNNDDTPLSPPATDEVAVRIGK